ncbi:hypothetical protein CLV35_2151 [Motilibacter peucedani]|uniref:Uncharacterized protein n=1 Tax=Motilibacter peucedani TaxID=598650 RepID=A0A420XR19_9ACTN|nr:hypothetical protein [Motilibacter peucedani]RKS75674.1 hypothetical protein CLV35_2151 [Motilibacter peucedani]
MSRAGSGLFALLVAAGGLGAAAPARADVPPVAAPQVTAPAPLVGAATGSLLVDVRFAAPVAAPVVALLEGAVPGDGPRLPLAADGLDWTGAVPVSAAQAGTWTLADVTVGGELVPHGAALATAVVQGSDAPAVTFAPVTRVPVPRGSTVVIAGRAVLGDSGRPAARLRLAVWSSALAGGPPSEPVPFVRTDAQGRFRWTQLMDGRGDAVVSVARVLGEQVVQRTQLRVAWLRTSVTAVPSATRARAGARVVVRGRVQGAPGAAVLLQRRVGARWVPLAGAASRAGAYAVPFRLPAGRTTLRVVQPRTAEWRSSVSRSVVVTGVRNRT